jgi:5-aminopentanamidase
VGTTVRIACCQLSPNVERPERNAALARQAIAAAVGEGAQIVVLPELSNSGYVFRSAEEVEAAAVARDGELLQGWIEEAGRGGALVIGGFCERGPDGRLHNSSALVDGEGLLAVYRKLHLWNEEASWAGSGPAR